MRMRILLLSVLGLTIAGCGSAPVTLPDWDTATRTPEAVVSPAELPLLCEIPWTHDDCWAAVERYEVVSEANQVIATEMGLAVRATESAYDALISAGRAQQQYGVIKQQQLDRCVSDAFSDKWMYRAVIVGITALAVSQ